MNSRQYVRIRDKESYSDSLKSVLNILNINEVPRIVGSYNFVDHKYPGDVDVREVVTVEGSRDLALDIYTNQLQGIAKQLYIMKNKIFVDDFKSGIDERFNYIITPETNQIEMKNVASQLKNQGLISDKEFAKMMSVSNDWEAFSEEIRLLKVVRWTLEEIIDGHRYLRKNKRINLRDAISMNAITKIDTIAYIDNRYQGVEVFYVLQYKDNGTLYSFFNQNEYYYVLMESFRSYIRKDKYNPLKAIKRIWNLSFLIDCKQTVLEVIPALSSNAAALNQIKSDIEMLRDLAEKFPNASIETMFTEVINFQHRAFNHMTPAEYVEYIKIADPIFKLYLAYQNCGVFISSEFVRIIDNIEDYLKPLINRESDLFLRKVKNSPLFCQPLQFIKHEVLPSLQQTEFVTNLL